MSEETATATKTAPQSKVRTVAEVERDLADARMQFVQTEIQVRQYREQRETMIKYVDQLKKAWAANTGGAEGGMGMPFNPQMYNPPAVVPPQGTLLTDQFHALHVRIGKLESERVAAKKAETGA